MGKRSGNNKKKDKVILPPELPEVDDDQVVVSDEDIEFFSSDKRRTDLFRKFDKKSVDSYVKRVAGKDEGEVKRLYEESERKRKAADALRPRRQKDDHLEVDPVDSLPIKTLQGGLVYNNAKKARSEGIVSGVKWKLKRKVQMPNKYSER